MDTSDARQLVQDLRRRYTDSSRHEAAFIERVAVTLIALADEVDRLNAELHNYKAAAAEEARFADECENRVSDLNDDLDSDNAIIKHLDSHVRRLTQENERLRQACEALDKLEPSHDH